VYLCAIDCCIVVFVQFINLQTLDLSGNHITHIDNLHTNKVLCICFNVIFKKSVTKSTHLYTPI